MSRSALFLLFKIRGKSKFYFTWPIPLFSFLMFSDMFVDITDLLAIFSRYDEGDGQKKSMRALNRTARSIHAALCESTGISGPYELMNVETDSVCIQLKVV